MNNSVVGVVVQVAALSPEWNVQRIKPGALLVGAARWRERKGAAGIAAGIAAGVAERRRVHYIRDERREI